MRMLCTVQCPPRGAPSNLGISDEFGCIVEHASQVCHLWLVLVSYAGGVLGRRAKRRAGAEAGSVDFDEFVAAFDPCESHVMRSDRVSVILHEPQSQNSQPHNSQVHLRVPCMMCMLHDVFRIRRIRWEVVLYKDWASA